MREAGPPALPTWARPPLPPSPGLCHAVLPIVDRPSTWGHTRPPLPSCPLPQGCPFTRPRQSAQRSSLAGRRSWPQRHGVPSSPCQPRRTRPNFCPLSHHTVRSSLGQPPSPPLSPAPWNLLWFLPLKPPVAHPAKPSPTQSSPTRKKSLRVFQMAGFNMRSWSQRSWLPEARGAQGTVVTQSPPWLCPRGAGLLAEPLCSLGQASTPLSSAVTPGFAQRLEVSDGEHPAQCQDIVGAVQRAASVHKGPEHPPGKAGSRATLEAPWLEVTRSRRGGGGLNLIPSERPSGELMWTRSWGETPVKNQVGGWRSGGPDPMQGACPRGKQERQEAQQEGPQAAV